MALCADTCTPGVPILKKIKDLFRRSIVSLADVLIALTLSRAIKTFARETRI